MLSIEKNDNLRKRIAKEENVGSAGYSSEMNRKLEVPQKSQEPCCIPAYLALQIRSRGKTAWEDKNLGTEKHLQVKRWYISLALKISILTSSHFDC